MGLAMLMTMVGQTPELAEEFNVYWNALMDFFKEQGGRTGRVPWAEADAKREMIVTQRKRTQIAAPEDTFLEESDYYAKYGDPATNKLGHREAQLKGMKGYIIPGAREWKIRRFDENLADIQQHVDNGEVQVLTA